MLTLDCVYLFILCTRVCQEKEQQWQNRVKKLTSSQQKALQDRQERLKMFRVRALHAPDFSMQCLHTHTHTFKHGLDYQ